MKEEKQQETQSLPGIAREDGRTKNRFGKVSHGLFSVQIRQRYSDARTSEGRQLREIMRGLTNDLGGEEALSTAQRLILGAIKTKLIVLFQIGKFVDRQEDVVTKDGFLIPCLDRNATTWLESLRRDLEALGIKRKGKPLSLDEYIKRKAKP